MSKRYDKTIAVVVTNIDRSDEDILRFGKLIHYGSGITRIVVIEDGKTITYMTFNISNGTVLCTINSLRQSAGDIIMMVVLNLHINFVRFIFLSMDNIRIRFR